MDRTVHKSTLRLDGRTVYFDTGPPMEEIMVWPGTGDRREASLSFEPRSSIGGTNHIKFAGPWAWFKFIDQAQTRPIAGQPDRFKVTASVGGREAEFELGVNSFDNPFDLSVLRRFRCPETL